jgi:ABC-type polysaccharide/polyol phosphate transport system ATPase subunit
MLREGEIVADQIWKRFRPDLKRRRLAAHLRHLPSFLRGQRTPWMWALADVSFRVEPGEAVGLVGTNGSGKSTLLKILNKVMYPYAGSVESEGRTGALIEVTTGLHPELTGRENVLLYGSLLGLRRREVTARFDAIVDFADIEFAIDRQLKFYSSGMKMRLGFAVAAFLEPAILLVDEVLAVGDAQFQQRCLDRMSEVHNQGTTVVYVSHDLPTVEAACSRAIWLHGGEVQRDGPVREVLSDYRGAVEQQAALNPVEGTVHVRSVTVNRDGAPIQTGAPLEVELELASPFPASADVHVGITQGTPTPVLLVTNRVQLENGATTVRCRLASLPVPRGRFYVWVAIGPPAGSRHTLLTWGPVAQIDVGGPVLTEAPRGVVRLSPVYVDAQWSDG